MTQQTITNSHGVTFTVGDRVHAKGSKVIRRIVQIDTEQSQTVALCASRADGGTVAPSAWLDIEKTVLVTE